MNLPTLKDFKNEPYIDFSKSENRKELEELVLKVEKELGKTYSFVINGERISVGKLAHIKNPANLAETIGKVYLAENKHLEQAIEVAEKAFEKWRFVPYYERAEKLLRAAKIVKERKLQISVWLSKENGKSIRESVADVAEGIDFMEYYARKVNEIGSAMHEVFDAPGEKNKLLHIPLGIGAVIAPWNFPFAILAGMTCAALVTGNTVIMKPSSLTPVIAYIFYEILQEAGFPSNVVSYLPGNGSVIGDRLAQHPKIRFVAFTGSTAVGKKIYGLAATFTKNQKWFKRMILETGGKNHVIVLKDANIKKAAEGVARSAFGYSGQKCSACSVAVVEEQIYDMFITELIAYTKKLTLGDGLDPEVFTGPVIDQNSVHRIKEYINLGKNEGKILLGGNYVQTVNGKTGYYIEPTIITDLPDNSRILKEEIFGPVLAVRKAEDFESALEMANATNYGLTGGVFTTNPIHKEHAKDRFHVGNLYINKQTGGSTGAMVGRQPFGGFNLSGTDSKAGGPQYLYLFMQEKSVTEMV